MKKALIELLKHRLTRFGLILAVFYQFLFIAVWMTGYGSMPNNLSHLKVAIINEDQSLGKQLAKKLDQGLPYQTKVMADLTTAKSELNHRDIQMIVRIPSDFTKRVKNPKKVAHIQFLVNESNPMLVSSTTEQLAASVTQSINQQIGSTVLTETFRKLGVSNRKIKPIIEQTSREVTADIKKIHHVTSMAYQMTPFMISMAGFVASMVLQLNMFNAGRMLSDIVGGWRMFFARSTVNVVTSVIVAFIATFLITLFGAPINHHFFIIWGFQCLAVLAFMFFTKMFVLAFGIYGLIPNLTFLIVQVIISGAVIPRVVLPPFYYNLGNILPMTYALQGNMDLILGGPSIAPSAWILVIFILVCLDICFLLTAYDVDKEKRKRRNRGLR
ncbi:YhgE/Pip domain-containing protein [Camelliibacillus cellulosilyticus]|uniref:YhgE/Pip domain-containing protein n=1 Tax=Camelliibacillus cellulosilyticus TaxID=2174486 RepID=A0ABV9GQN4_9BACL